MSRAGLSIAALFLAACAGSPPPAPKTTIVLSPPIDSSSASPAADADAAPPAPPAPLEPPLVALPEPAACVMTTSRWRGAKVTNDLRFREGGPIFAHVSGGKASLHLRIVRSRRPDALVQASSALIACQFWQAPSGRWMLRTRGSIRLGMATASRARVFTGASSTKTRSSAASERRVSKRSTSVS